MRIQPAISSRVRRHPEQCPTASSAQTLMHGDIGRARTVCSETVRSCPSMAPSGVGMR